jgi:arginyl-tRNA synthetase
MLYVVASQQELHLRQLFKITELMGNEATAKLCQHISFGLVLGMSTRRGTVKLQVLPMSLMGIPTSFPSLGGEF